MVESVSHSEWGMSTNFLAIFEMILDEAKVNNLLKENMIEKIIVLTDMQFNEAGENLPYKAVEKMYIECGYKVP